VNPFEPGNNTEIPLPPFEIPTPELPANDFVAVGRDIAKGQAESGWFDQLWQSLTKFIALWVGTAAGAIIKLFGWGAVYVARIFLVARSENEDTLAEASAAAIGDLFGVPVQSQWFKQLANTGQRGPIAKTAAEGLLNALGGSFSGSGATQLGPSSDRAEQYVTTMMNLCIEGWLEGWIMEALSAGQLETFAELKDICANALGLGRMTRRVLAAPLKILVEDPFTWKLNNIYRPTLFSSATAVRQFLRGRITRVQLDTELGYQGWSAEKIEGLINESQLHLPVGDLVTLIAHNELDATLGAQMLRDQGYSDTQAQMALRIEHLKRGDTLALEIARQGIEAWAVGSLSDSDLQQFIDQDGITEQERTYLGILKDLRGATKRKQFSIGQAETMVKKGIWSIERFQGWAFIEGYSSDDERDLELLLFSDIKDASDAAKKRADAAAAAAQKAKDATVAALAKKAATELALGAKGVSISKFETLVKDGIRTIDQYRSFLIAKEVSADNQVALIHLLSAELDKAQNAAANKDAHSATAALKNLNLGELDKAVRSGIISIAEYTARITDAGFTPADVDILVGLAVSDLAAADTRAQTKADAKATAAVKKIDLSQEERAVRLGLKTLADYTAFLTANGYAAEDAALLSGELASLVASDKAAQLTRAQATAAAQKKGLSLTDLERAVRAGVKTVEDYRAALVSLGYTGDAQSAMVALLQLTLDTDAQTLAARGQASAVLGQRGVSLTDLERAVKVGVVPISVYSEALGRAGVTADDANILTLTLAAQVSAQQKAAKASPNVNTLLKAAGLSLTTLRASVLKGTLTVDQFQSALTGAGIDQASVMALVSVISDELANQQAIAAKLVDAAARAKTKGLSLSEETAAVKANVKTIDDYYQFVLDLGFDPADAETLTATLEAQLTKSTAAKSAPSPTPA
jgi:hypothetical protein